MRVLVVIISLFAVTGCGLIALPFQIATADIRRENELRQALALEEQAIMSAKTIEEVTLHQARWELYMNKLRASQVERASRRAAWRRQWVQTHCTGHISDGGYWQATCQEFSPF